jgi:SagB-type dehydrogenase family enzyme
VDIVLHHRFSDDVRAVGRDGTRIALDVPGWKTLAFSAPTASLADAIEALGGEGADLERLTTLASVGMDPGAASERVAYYLERFRRARLLEWVARRDGEVLVTFRSLKSGFGLAEGAPPAHRMTLSRFAYARRDGADLVLESPETPCRAILTGAGTELLRRIAEQGVAMPAADRLVEPFWRTGFLEAAGDAEPDDRATWEFHDLLFHVASHSGRDALPFGGTYRFKGRFPAPPAIKARMSVEAIALARPDEDAIAAGSDRLAAVMDRRRSIRAFGETPMSVTDLSQFLFRVARITRQFEGDGQELLFRPFPSGGAIHEIEFYVAVGACRDLEPGLYHYLAIEHALELIPDSRDGASRILAGSVASMGDGERPPHIVVVLASRLPRLAWKYQSLAYRLTLMNAGVALQTMYLVATDMGLACCATGSTNTVQFAQSTGLDPTSETAIAEFALGGKG